MLEVELLDYYVGFSQGGCFGGRITVGEKTFHYRVTLQVVGFDLKVYTWKEATSGVRAFSKDNEWERIDQIVDNLV